MKRVASLVTGLVLIMAIAAFAQGTTQKTKAPKAKAPVTHSATGTISSVEGDRLVLSHKVKGKEEQTTFMMSDQTKKEGELKAGEKATVHYTVSDNMNMATLVRASATMAKAPKTKK